MWHKIEIIGNLGAKPDMKFTPSGQAVTAFSLAANRNYKKGEEWVKETVWFRVEVWGNQAEYISKLEKGAPVLVVGRLKPDTGTGAPRIWKNKAGEPQTSFEVTASEVKPLAKREHSQESQAESEIPAEDDPF